MRLETARLSLLPLGEDDFADYARLLADDEAARKELHASTASWRAHGFGHWALRDRAGGAFVGVIESHPAYPGVEGIEPGEPELGWTIAETRQGEGLATEAARAVAGELLARNAIDHLVAYIRHTNPASRRVAEKIDMRVRGPGRSRDGAPVEIWELRRQPWRPGEQIVLRSSGLGCGFHLGRPLTVVEDGVDWLVTYLAAGSPVSIPTLPDGRAIREAPLEERWLVGRASRLGRWEGGDLVMLFPRDGAYSLWIFRDAELRAQAWYVNLEERHRRGARTIDTRDNVLDIVVDGTTHEPRWKDEDELAAAIAQGRVTAEQAVAIRAEGERVLAERPWPTGWEDFRPDPSWPVPELPESWSLPNPR